jgi:hypothetical protein
MHSLSPLFAASMAIMMRKVLLLSLGFLALCSLRLAHAAPEAHVVDLHATPSPAFAAPMWVLREDIKVDSIRAVFS